MFRVVLTMSVVAAALALTSCNGSISQATCTTAATSGKWDVTFRVSSGPTTCPKLDTTDTLPGACDTGCSCPESEIVWEAPSGAQQEGSCLLNLSQTCPGGITLDCRNATVESATSASGACFYHGVGTDGPFDCQYLVTWTKQ